MVRVVCVLQVGWVVQVVQVVQVVKVVRVVRVVRVVSLVDMRSENICFTWFTFTSYTSHKLLRKVEISHTYIHAYLVKLGRYSALAEIAKKKFTLNLCCFVAAVFSHMHIPHILHLSCYTMQHVIRFRKQTFFKSQLTVVSPCEKFLIDWVLMQYGEILQE